MIKIDVDLGARLKTLRKETGLSMANVADCMGYGLRSVQDWEHNYRLPGYNAILALADFFNVNVGYIMGVEARVDS